MDQATQDRPSTKKRPVSDFRVEVAEPDPETGTQYVRIRADCYAESVIDLYDMLRALAARVAQDVEKGVWRNA